MTPNKPHEPTDAEWRVLKIVWENGPSSASDVIERAAPREGWSTSTVKTLLRRLVEKGFLRTKRVGNSFLYSSSRSPMQALRRAGDALIERAAEGSVGPLLAHLVKRSDLRPDDLERLRALLDEKSEEVDR